MSARDFRPLFIALLFGVSASAYSQTNLPEGAGREIVQSKCAGCHELGRVLRSGYSAQDWGTVVHMMNNVGAQVPDEQLPILVKYLAENFPEKPRPLAGHRRSDAGCVQGMGAADTRLSPP